MSKWKKVKIGDFLTESKVLAEESDAAHRITVRLNCKGVEKRGLKAEKEGATKYYTRYAGQFIYGKQNIHKGAFGIIPSELDGYTSSADLPAFDIDESKCVPEWIPLSLKVNERYKTLQKEVKGVGSQRLAVNVFLNVEIPLPEVSIQREILAKVGKKITSIALLDDEIEKQKNYVKQLRQNILQEAIEGKLTEEWRKVNPVVKGNPDFDAESLFEKIQEEKCHTDSELLRNSKKKVFEPIAENEQPFEIPEGWKWVKLEHLAEVGTGATPLTSEKKYYENGTIPWITSSSTGNDFVSKADVFITEIALKETNCSLNPKGTLVVAMYGQGKTRGQITELCIEAATNQACATIKIFEKDNVVLKKYIKFVFKKMYEEIRSLAQGGTQPNLNLGKIANTIFPLPPLAEQKEIVSRVEKLLANVTELEKQITEREEMTKQLMQSIMKDAFKEV